MATLAVVTITILYDLTASQSHFKRQVIILLGDDPNIQKAAHFLNEKNKNISHVVKLDKIDHKPNYNFAHVQWNNGIGLYLQNNKYLGN